MDDKIPKYILAGGPTSGKSTTITAFKQRGFPVIGEAAREVLEEKKYNDTESIQKEIFLRQITRENSVKHAAFFDRSALEGVAYSLLFLGKIPECLANYDFRNLYSKVFFLDRFPLVLDGTRIEKNDAEAERVHQTIYGVYVGYGYNPIRVPKMSVEDRVDFILENIRADEHGSN